ncbi:MAG: hypothetical protein H7A23_25660 [Leptospiraceae bacterium]|nr:hypothetical protein [Leptospiraceae bacterium]MCP5497955.1 hypothetical protein [Leptospiraceae bacterium]
MKVTKNKILQRWILFGAITCLTGVVSSLEINKQPYKIGEFSPELVTFEGTGLDPLTKEIFYRSPTGVVEYDRLLETSNKVLILTKFGSLTVDSYYNKKKSNQDLTKELLAVKFLKVHLPEIQNDWKTSIQTGQMLMKNTNTTTQLGGGGYNQCVRYNAQSTHQIPVALTSALYRLCRASRELQRIDFCVNRIYNSTPTEVMSSLENPANQKQEEVVNNVQEGPDFIPQFSFEDEEKPKEESKSTVQLENEAIKSRKEGNFDQSIEKFKKANQEREESGTSSTYGAVIDYYNIAKIYYTNKYDPCEGAKWMKKGLDLEEKIDISKAAVNRKLYKKMRRECRDLEF